MSTRILWTGLICAALLGSAFPVAAAVRPEISQPLKEAVRLSQAIHPDKMAIAERIRTAEAVPNQTLNEKSYVNRVLDGLQDRSEIGPFMQDQFDALGALPPTAGLPPGDVGRNAPNNPFPAP
jgi:hypothetical protein